MDLEQHEKKQIQTQRRIPTIRFPGFTDPWEQRKLGSIYELIGNAFVGTVTPYYVESGHFYLESNNIKDGQINHNMEVFINDEFYEKQKDKWLHTGDMVMVQSGHVGHAAVIPEELNNSAAHALIMFRHSKVEIEPYFLNYQYQTLKSKKKIENITTGNTIKHILASDMQQFEVDMSNLEEQKKIAEYFRNLDHLITLHQRKLDILKQYKTGVETQLFSEISTTKKIKDIIEILPKTNHPAGVGQSKGVYRFYTNNSTEQLYFDTFDYDAEAIISNTGGNANFEYCNDKFAASMHCMTFTSNINTKYLYYVLSYFVNRINFECFRGNGLKCLDKSWFANFDVPVPNVSEQNEITAILSEIDQLLYKEIHILNNLKLLKQGLLQQMFI